MSNNPSDLFVFVKGNKGKCAYFISDNNFAELYKTVEDGIHDAQGNPKPPAHTDYEALIKSLEYIEQHRGRGGIPGSPVVFVYSSVENNSHVFASLKNPNPSKTHMVEYVSKIKDLMGNLQRKERDNIKFLFVPKKFKNQMGIVDEMSAASKQRPPVP